MSTVVAVEKESKTAIAWDQLTIHGSTRNAHAVGARKVHRFGDSAVGTAGFALYYNILEHYLESLEPARVTCERDVFAFFLNFEHSLGDRYTLVNSQYDREDPSPFADIGAEFIVASAHGIFRVKEVLSLSKFDAFCAIGSGADHAEGALEVLYSQSLTAKEIAIRAFGVAAIFDAATGKDCSVIEL